MPAYCGGACPPESIGPPPEGEVQLGDPERERWHAKYREWVNDLAALYDTAVPEDARGSTYFVGSGWDFFLSICVLFDPPETQLEEFADRFHWGQSNFIPRKSRQVMFASPIVRLRDGDRVEVALRKVYEGILAALLEKYVHPQGVTTEDAMRAIYQERPELLERLNQSLRDNESHLYIEVKPYHTQKDIESAFRMLSGEQDVRPARGRGNRDKLSAVQCAILKDRYGWKYEDIAKKYGWDQGSNKVSKYIRDGRLILAGA
jgi:hypothetical protein